MLRQLRAQKLKQKKLPFIKYGNRLSDLLKGTNFVHRARTQFAFSTQSSYNLKVAANFMKISDHNIRMSNTEDIDSILELYKRVSKNAMGLARTEREITREYVQNFTEKSIKSGLQLVMVAKDDAKKVIAEIHSYKLEPSVFAHIFSELTIAVCPDYQGQNLGKTLFQALLDFVKEKREDIFRVELIARESNTRAIHLYESLGFVKEGKLHNRIRRDDGSFEADIPMAWFNPSLKNILDPPH